LQRDSAKEEDSHAKAERRGFLFIDFFNGPDPLELDSIQWLGGVLCIWVMSYDGESSEVMIRERREEHRRPGGCIYLGWLDFHLVAFDQRLGYGQVSYE
jgi:hypothetical protein